MKQISKRILTVSALAMAVAAPHVSAANWSDTFVGYRYGSNFDEPSKTDKIKKNILSFTHASGYDYGQNFLNVDLLQSNSKDPAAGDGTDGKGALEAYVTYRHQLHLGKVFNQDFSFGPVKEVAVTAGFDANTKNTTFAPRKKMFVVGPTLKFDVPKGFLDFSVLYAHETNHKNIPAINVNEDVTFNDYTIYNLTWGLPFNVGIVPMKFQGFGNWATPKGQGTTDERLVRTSLMVDAGQLAFNKADTVWLGVGYEHWRNKFGNGSGPGIDTDAMTVNAEWHF